MIFSYNTYYSRAVIKNLKIDALRDTYVFNL